MSEMEIDDNNLSVKHAPGALVVLFYSVRRNESSSPDYKAVSYSAEEARKLGTDENYGGVCVGFSLFTSNNKDLVFHRLFRALSPTRISPHNGQIFS